MRFGKKILTQEYGIINIEKLIDKKFKVKNLHNEWVNTECQLSPGKEKLLKVLLDDGSEIYTLKDDKWPILIHPAIIDKKTTNELKTNMKIHISSYKSFPKSGIGNYRDGYLVGIFYACGLIKYDCGFNIYCFEILHDNIMYNSYIDILQDFFGLKNTSVIGLIHKDRVELSKDTHLFMKYNVLDINCISDYIFEFCSYEFINGLLKGFSDYTQLKNNFESIIYKHSCSTLLRDIQLLFSYIHGTHHNFYQYEDYFYLTTDLENKNFKSIVEVVETNLKEHVCNITVKSDDHCFNIGQCYKCDNYNVNTEV